MGMPLTPSLEDARGCGPVAFPIKQVDRETIIQPARQHLRMPIGLVYTRARARRQIGQQ
jgi:hypothetical protein